MDKLWVGQDGAGKGAPGGGGEAGGGGGSDGGTPAVGALDAAAAAAAGQRLRAALGAGDGEEIYVQVGGCFPLAGTGSCLVKPGSAALPTRPGCRRRAPRP
jgi:hypothetical protein